MTSDNEASDGAEPLEENVAATAAVEQGDSDTEQTEAAPTDFRRHIWLLVVIVVVVLAAWIAEKSRGDSATRDANAPQGPLDRPGGRDSTTGGPVSRPSDGRPSGEPSPSDTAPPPPLTYEAGLADQQERALRRVLHVLGRPERFLDASPAHRRPGEGNTVRPAMLFDVSRVAQGASLADFVPRRYLDSVPVLGRDPSSPPQFTTAGQVVFLKPGDYVIVLSVEGETRAYPTRILLTHGAICDKVGGRQLLVCWSDLTQLARCFVLPAQDTPSQWSNAGRLYRGNLVLADSGTGSLWDAASGRALTGPRVGESLQRVPVVVHPWPGWRAANPDALVLTDRTGVEGFREAGAYDTKAIELVERYLSNPRLPFAVPGYHPDRDGQIRPKEFVIGLRTGAGIRAYPLHAISEAGGAVTEELAGQEVSITVTSPRTAYAADEDGRLLDADVMLWFGWRSLNPDGELWLPDSQ